MSEWQQIETATEDGNRVDLWVNEKPGVFRSKGGYRLTDCILENGVWYDQADDPVEECCDMEEVTHWRLETGPGTSVSEKSDIGNSDDVTD